MNSIFVDRKEVTERVLEKMESRVQSQVYLLYAETGVGKTALSHKLSHTMKNRYPDLFIADVFMNPINESSNIKNFDYIIEIFKKLYNLFSKKSLKKGEISFKQYEKYSFCKYVGNCKNPSSRKHLLEFIDEQFIKTSKVKGDILREALDVLFQRVFNIGIFDEDNIVEELEKNIAIVNDYIEYILKSSTIILHIDNVQNMDVASQKCILELIASSIFSRSIFLLEYTITEHSEDRLARFSEYLKMSGAEIHEVGLKKLTESHIVEIALSNYSELKNDSSFVRSIKTHYSMESNGNLFEFKNFLLTYDQKEPKDHYNSLKNNLFTFTTNERFVVAVLVLHSGKVQWSILKAIISNSDLFLSEEELIDIVENNIFIKRKDEEVFLTHASIIDAWEESAELSRSPVYFAAYKFSSEYYERLLAREMFFSVSREECLNILLELFLKFDKFRLISYIDEFVEIASTALSTQETWHKAHVIFDILNQRSSWYENELFQIVDLLINNEMFEKAQYCIENMSANQNKKIPLYRCAISHLREKHMETLAIIEENYELWDKEADEYFCLYKIIALRSLNQIKELESYIDYLKRKKMFSNLYTYACFLRLAELYKPKDQAILQVQKSIGFFEQLHCQDQVAKARISLSFLLAITGNTESALQEICKSQNELRSTIRNKIIFSVNKSAALLLSGEISNKIWDMLDGVETLTHNTFNRIAILTNKMVYCLVSNDFEKGKLCAQKLIRELQNETDLHIIAIATYDLYVFFSRLGNDDSAKKYYNTAYKYREHCNTLNARFEKKHMGNETFLLMKPWHVCFLSYWDIDLKLP